MEDRPNQDKRFIEVWRTQNLLDYVLMDLERRIKRDRPTKLSVFFAGLSAYLPEPINLFLKGESGIGKTYNVVETLKYFPQEDIWFLGGLSPKALIHEHGILLNKYGEPIDLSDKPIKPKKKDYESEKEYREALMEYREELKAYAEEIRESYTLINLKNKILVFLEAPEFETFRMLYPILSHDTERIEYRFTDKSAKGPLRTVKVVIEGWPATIFLTTDRKYMEELSTRSFTATPEGSREKILEANKLTNLKVSFPWQFSEETEETKCIKSLIESLKRQLLDGKSDVLIPFPNLYELFPKEIIRDMRDFQHFCQFLKAITVLHFYQRPFLKIGEKRFIISSIEDVFKALEVYSEVFETTRTGTEQKILKFYHEIVKTKESWYLSELTGKYNELHKERSLSSDSIALMLKRLSEIGYVDVQKDGRLNVYRPLIMGEEKGEIHRILENRESLSSKLETSFKEWLNEYPKKAQFFYYKNFSENKWGETEISIEEASRIILKGFTMENFSSVKNGVSFGYPSEEKSKLKLENKLEDARKTEIRGFSPNSEFPQGLIPCELCAKQGKPMFFASKHDLDLHIKAFHGGYPDSKLDYVR
jgi:predicted transcriptional regulator